MYSDLQKYYLDLFSYKNNELHLGDLPISSIVAGYGTPAYIYYLPVAQKKVELLKRYLPDQISIHYAIKANPHPEIISFFNSQGLGFDVASKNELEAALTNGVHPNKCGFAGPGKSDSELKYAVKNQIESINVESKEELYLINNFASAMNTYANISLRLNPPFALKKSGMRMNGVPSAFGLDIGDAIGLLRELPSLKAIKFKGFHIFAGSQNLAHENIINFLEETFELLKTLLSECKDPVQLVNLGGGFGIPYFSNDVELMIKPIGEKLHELLQKYIDIFPDTRFIIETGRYLIGEAGIYVTSVRYRKASFGEQFLITDGGMHHHLAASGNLGQVVRKNFPILALNKLTDPASEVVTVAGPLCTPLDVLGQKINLPKLDRGDLIGIFASGAYGFTASPVNFLSHPYPNEIVIK